MALASDVTKWCEHCSGDGYFVYDGGPGRFDEWCGNWIPTELWVVCEACGGVGVQGEGEGRVLDSFERVEQDELPF